jgi:hypothetical protein
VRKTLWSKASVVALIVAAIVVGASIANAITTASFDPIWMIGWLPAVLVGALYGPKPGRRCSRLTLRRPRPKRPTAVEG